jgi:hypothetical protein
MPPFSGSNEPNPGSTNVTLATLTFPEIYDLVAKQFSLSGSLYPWDAKTIYITEPIPLHMGNIRQYNERDFSTFASTKPEGVAAAKAQFGLGYHKQLYLKRIAKELDLTDEAIMFDRWMDVTTIGVDLGETCPQRINLDMTQLAVTFAAGSSYVDQDGFTIDTTTGDGNPIAYSAHTLAFSSTTYTNIVPGNPQFSKSALISAEQVARNNTLNNYGTPRSKNWSHIWCSGNPNVLEAILQFIRSTSDNTQANPAVDNIYKNRYTMLKLEQLDTTQTGARDTTKSNYWGIGAFNGSTPKDRFWAMYGEWESPHMKPAPTSDNNAVDFSKDIKRFGVRAGYGLCVVNPMGIVYSFPTNS